MSHRFSLRAAVLALLVACTQVFVFAGPADAQVKLDLRDADLRSFTEIVSETTGKSFVIDPGVRGTVTVIAPDTLTPQELFEVFLNVLELNRLTIVNGGTVDRIVPMNVARELSSGAPRTAPKGFQTRVIEVENVPLNDIVEVIRPLLPAEAVLTPVAGSKLLILSDRGQNHARIEALVRRLDTPREQPIEMIRLRNANAAEVLQVIDSMGIVPEGAAVSVDRRSNALVVSGSDDLRRQLRALSARLDTQRNNVSSHAVELNYADATTLADVVTRAISNESTEANAPPIRIIPETQTNTLLITAPEERLDDIVQMIHFLDRRPSQVLVEAVIFEMSVNGFADLSSQFGAVLNDAIVGGGIRA
ncbi:secretin N-terminal domain-containing protein [Sulfitobacter aestuariivivens]|uniref:secretin N-terminal domain-containing protein n=1 Tax=Sulfitobacter aestuariivivens TaxID=2766981 RepID=UPI00362351C0